MWAILVIVICEFGERAPKMFFAEQDQLAQTFALHGLHLAFREIVHVRCLEGSAHDLHARVFEGAAELLRE